MRQPFFIVGTGRCGSTLALRMLDAHPRVAVTNEARVLDFLKLAIEHAAVPARQPARLRRFGEHDVRGVVTPYYAERFSAVLRDHVRPLLEEFYRREFGDREFTHWGDKLPAAETAIEAQEVLPEARYLVLMRDPRDCWCSWRSWSQRGDVDVPQVERMTVVEWSRSWVNVYSGLLRYLRHRLLVRYEQLLRDGAGELARMLGFLGLEGDAPALADAARARDTFGRHGTAPHAAASVGRWRTELAEGERAVIEAECGPLMREHGYEPSGG